MVRRGKSGAGSAQSGLTLIEVLVGLALLGALVAVLSGALRLGLLGRETVDTRAEWLDEVRVTQTFIRRYMETARPLTWFRDRRTVVAFDGEREVVSFVAAMPGWRSPGGLYLVRIAREGDRLVLTRRITSGGTEGFDFTNHAERTVLATGVAAVNFSYSGRPPTGGGTPRWQELWRKRASLPELVGLDLDYSDPKKGQWPILVVGTMIEMQPR